jgi:two-component system KDP operon response regulator KdpE
VTRVLVVDDEAPLRRALELNLRARGFDVELAGDGGEALRLAGRAPVDAVVLDLGLPDMDGLQVIEGLRGWSPVPIVVLSARSDTADTIAALEAGADDYVTKPFVVGELLARLAAVLRRVSAQPPAAQVILGDVVVDLAAHAVTRGAEPVHLSPTEWRLLEVLLRHPGMLVTQGELLRAVWGPAYETEAHYLRRYLAKLRAKLEVDPARPRHLLTEAGMGHRFQP